MIQRLSIKQSMQVGAIKETFACGAVKGCALIVVHFGSKDPAAEDVYVISQWR